VQLLKRHWLIASGIIVAIALLAAFKFKGSDKPQYFTTKVDRGDIRDVVEATGTINAVTTVQVGSQVSGTISHLAADFNSRVKKEQVIAQVRCCKPKQTLAMRRQIWQPPKPMPRKPEQLLSKRKLTMSARRG